MTVETKSKLSLEIQKSIKDLLKFQKETSRQINKLATETAKAFERASEAVEKNVKDTEK